MARSEIEQAEEFDGQFTDVFSKTLESEVPILDMSGVIKMMKGLNTSKALGPDELHLRVLEELVVELGPVFAHLFQQSLDMGEIPKEWSLAKICPFYKKSDRPLPSTYLPVSFTCIPCKMLDT